MTIVPVSLSAVAPALIAALIGWRVYRRMRRLIGRQPVRTGRLVAALVAFPLVVAGIAWSIAADPSALGALAAGVAIGATLGGWGLRLTRFQVVDGALSYVPDARIGIAVSLLFVGRLVYRFGVLQTTGRFEPATFQSFGRSPLTLAIFGIVAAYYTTSAAGILRWSWTARRNLRSPERPADQG